MKYVDFSSLRWLDQFIEFILPNLCASMRASNGTNCTYVCKLYVDALVSKCPTNQSSLKIKKNQKEIHEPNSTIYNCICISTKIWTFLISCLHSVKKSYCCCCLQYPKVPKFLLSSLDVCFNQISTTWLNDPSVFIMIININIK